MTEYIHYLSDKVELHSTLMTKLISEILKDVEIKSGEEQDAGLKATEEWSEGKSIDEQIEILLDLYGSDEEKSDYESWKSKL